MIDSPSVAALVHAFDPGADGEAAKSKELVLALLARSPQPFSRRQFNPGHITCTGLVLSPNRDSVLLVLHRRLQRWLLPGGHVELEDPQIGDAGRREVVEETGAILRDDTAPPLVGVDVHGIPPAAMSPSTCTTTSCSNFRRSPNRSIHRRKFAMSPGARSMTSTTTNFPAASAAPMREPSTRPAPSPFTGFPRPTHRAKLSSSASRTE